MHRTFALASRSQGVGILVFHLPSPHTARSSGGPGAPRASGSLSLSLRRGVPKLRHSRARASRISRTGNSAPSFNGSRASADRRVSALLHRSLWWRIWRQINPRVARLFPHCEGRRRETRVGKVADSNAEVSWKARILPENRRSAPRTEMKSHRVPAIGRPAPLRGFAGDGDLVIAVARLIADHGAGASLAGQAVAHSVARGFAFNRKLELPATAGGMACHCAAPSYMGSPSPNGSLVRLEHISSRSLSCGAICALL